MNFADLLIELDTQLDLATGANLEDPHVAADEVLCKMIENVFNNDSLSVEYLPYRSHLLKTIERYRNMNFRRVP